MYLEGRIVGNQQAKNFGKEVLETTQKGIPYKGKD
jgi:hypothetical protein